MLGLKALQLFYMPHLISTTDIYKNHDQRQIGSIYEKVTHRYFISRTFAMTQRKVPSIKARGDSHSRLLNIVNGF